MSVNVEPEARLSGNLEELLFGTRGLSAYAVLDGASIPELLPKLSETDPPHWCLYRGTLSPQLSAAAPYLVELGPEDAFSSWLIQEGWGAHWGIFALAYANLVQMRKHFRTLTVVKDPEGKRLYFRFYDPRVLRVFLPTCNSGELAACFGPVQRYLMEGKQRQILSFAYRNGKLETEAGRPPAAVRA